MKSADMTKSENKTSNSDSTPDGTLKQDKRTLWEEILHLDAVYSEKFAVCARSDSSHGYMRPMMKLLELTCHGIPWYIVTFVGISMAYKPEDIEFLINLLIGLILDIIVVGLLKVIVRRARPAHNHMDMFATISVDNYSFPSGHATRAAMLLMTFEDKVFPLYSSVWCWLMFFWSLSIGCSRVILGRHHVLDVICGFIIGIAQYYVLVWIWLPASTCISILEPFLGYFHL